jgi:hypothetical protein
MMRAILQPFRADLHPASSILATGLAIAYVVVTIWFHQIDFYHQHFFDHGSSVIVYQLARVFFLLALAWLVYAVRSVCFAPSIL